MVRVRAKVRASARVRARARARTRARTRARVRARVRAKVRARARARARASVRARVRVSHHLKEYAAECPDVGRAVVRLTGAKLWRHVEWRAAERLGQGVGRGELLRQAKVAW